MKKIKLLFILIATSLLFSFTYLSCDIASASADETNSESTDIPNDTDNGDVDSEPVDNPAFPATRAAVSIPEGALVIFDSDRGIDRINNTAAWGNATLSNVTVDGKTVKMLCVKDIEECTCIIAKEGLGFYLEHHMDSKLMAQKYVKDMFLHLLLEFLKEPYLDSLQAKLQALKV